MVLQKKMNFKDFVYNIIKMVIYFIHKLKIIKRMVKQYIIQIKNNNGFGQYIKMIY